MSKKKLGILGGTFDPIHMGHLLLAEEIWQALDLEQLIFIPAYVAPHKQGWEFAPAQDRYNMTQLAIAGRAGFTVSDMELKRSGVSYTVDTLKLLRERYPEYELYFIIGADSVTQLHTWHRVEEQLQLAHFVAAGRPGYTHLETSPIYSMTSIAREKIILLQTPEYNISSTEIRTRIRNNERLENLVPKQVEAYIRERGLYLNRS